MTIKEIIQKITKKLQKNNHELIDLQANIIVSHILKIDNKFLYSFFDKEVNEEQLREMNDFLLDIENKPIQLILGYTFVNNIFLYVTKDTLLPGSETSGFINIITSLLLKKSNIKMVDAGTGSGVISISIAKSIPNIKRIFAIDKSQKALNIVQKNIDYHNISKIKLVKGDWLEPLIENNIKDIDLIVANPPYVKTDNISDLPNIFKDNTPTLSINGGQDGLEHFRKIINNAKVLLKNKGFLLLQADEYQTDKVIKIIKNDNSYTNVIVFAGTTSLPRFIFCEKK